MNTLYRLTEVAYDKKIDATGLGIFRIVYSVVLFLEVCQIFYFKNLIFDKIPFQIPCEIDVSLGLSIWLLCIVFLCIGLFTRVIAIANYVFSLIFIATISTYEYHMFYAYVSINFLLMFCSSSAALSLDNLLDKLKNFKVEQEVAEQRKISVLNYYVIPLVLIGFIYFDSIFYKTASYNWTHGLGMWLPASYPQFIHYDNSLLLNVKWLSIGLGYLTFFFEFIFLFTFFIKRFRIPLLIIGIGLHIGIFIEFPIPWFAIGMTGCYLLLIPVKFWKCLKQKIAFKSPSFSIDYNYSNRKQLLAVIFLEHFDVFDSISFKKYDLAQKEANAVASYPFKGIARGGKIYYGVEAFTLSMIRVPLLFPLGILLSVPFMRSKIEKFVGEMKLQEKCSEAIAPLFRAHAGLKRIRVNLILLGLCLLGFFQVVIIYNSFSISYLKNTLGFTNTTLDLFLTNKSHQLERQTKIFLGMTAHPVFMDFHFFGYNHVIAVEGVDQLGNKYWLPIIDKRGFADTYNYGFNWVKWTFRVNSPQIDTKQLENGIRDFTAFWAGKEGFDITTFKFNIYVKKVDSVSKWEQDFLKRQISKPWIPAGTAFWEDEKFVCDLPDIEKL